MVIQFIQRSVFKKIEKREKIHKCMENKAGNCAEMTN